MEQRYSYLDIAISSRDAEGAWRHKSFNGAPIVTLPSLRVITTHFESLQEGYMMWNDEGKRNVLYFVIGDDDKGASLLVNVRADENLQLEGGWLVNLFGAIRTRMMAGGEFTDGAIEGLVAQAGFASEPRKLAIVKDADSTGRSICCRSYDSRTELIEILTYPDQEAYLPYKAVLVYSEDAHRQADSTLPVITAALDKSVVAAPEVESVSVVVCFDFGDGRLIEVPLDMERNGDEYQNLRGGNFHGFHARGVLGRRGEAFNVDVHTPVEQPVIIREQPVVTVTEVVPTENEETSEIVDEQEWIEEESKHGRRIGKLIFRWLIVLAIAAGLFWFGWFLMEEFWWPTKANESMSPDPVNVEMEVVSVEPVPVATEIVPEEETVPVDSVAMLSDAAYLNSTNRWDKARLQTPQYQQIFTALASGDIDGVVRHDYFVTTGRASNKTAVKVADMLWKSKNTPTEASNVKALKNMGITDRVDVYEVMKAIERYQPVEPNSEPRPVK